jgi:CHAT domain-containing protein/cytochrome c-type biogenesis protein CcmH/NrfG
VLKPGHEHLTEYEIDRLAGLSLADHAAVEEHASTGSVAADHLSQCQSCRGRLEATRRLAFLKNVASSSRGEFCPGDEELMSVAAGLLDAEASEKMLGHAAQCDHCGPLLNRFIQDFSDTVSPSESGIIAKLGSSSVSWQKAMAVRLSTPRHFDERQARAPLFSWLWRVPALAAAAVVVASVLIWTFVPRPERRVERLIAEAYTEHRNLELRIAGADFAPVRMERAQQTSHLDSPPSLLEAENEISRHLVRNPSDPFWLQSRARAELLEGNYGGAIDALRAALAVNANSSSLLVDLASAYSQRGDVTGTPADYGRAVDLLGRALQISPQDPIALFNRGIVARKAHLFTQAIQDWQSYVQIDPTGSWADEARSRMEEAKQEQEKRKGSSLHPLLAPSQFSALNLDQASAIDAVAEHLETYYEAALSQWIPLAYPTTLSESSDSNTARTALHKLSTISLNRHSDEWWTDLLRGSSSPPFPAALNALSTAILANERGSTEAAHRSAALAIQYFRSAGGNEAGILRARVEDVYAANIEQDAEKCARLLKPLANASRIRVYPWLAIEMNIQEGNCLWLQEKLGDALAAYSSAANEAAAVRYTTIQLGAQDHWSMAAGAIGDDTLAWRLATDGLEQFWNGTFADVRGYNFYYSLYETARITQKPYLEVSIWKEAIPLTESSPDLAQVAVAHSLFGNSALATHDSERAFREFDRANQLFLHSPQTEATHLAQLEASTRMAGVETTIGQNRNAVSRLRSIAPEVSSLSDNYLKVLFYDTLGKALISEGDTMEAEKALRSAVRLAKLQLRSVRDSKSRIEWKNTASESYRDLISLLDQKHDTEDALELWEEFKAAPARVPKFDDQGSDNTMLSATISMTGVDAHLLELSKATVVTYALLPRELLVWTYDNRGVHSSHVRISAAKLSISAASFRELCSRPSSDPTLIRQLARSLYDQLVAPIEAYLESGRTLIFELDEGLNGIPMEVLLDKNNHYLGERDTIMSSLGILYSPRKTVVEKIGADTPALVVAVSAPHAETESNVSALPDVDAEGQTIASRFRVVHLLDGQNATLNATLEGIAEAGVFHFAGHASNSYLRPGLLLSDATLTVSSLGNLRMPRTQLVVLSACDSEAGSIGSAEAADSLVGHFARAGVPRIVASRWNVDSSLTRRFMAEFYGRLLKGFSVEESLSRSQSVLRTQSTATHPFYWAAFTVFGAEASSE